MIRLRLVGVDSFLDTWWCYELCGLTVLTDRKLEALSTWYAACQPDISSPGSAELIPPDSDFVTMIYQGPGWLGNELREVTCRSDSDQTTLLLQVAGLDSLMISADHRTVMRIPKQPEIDLQLLIETVLGPGLILLLAFQNIFCLHASAALIDGRLCAFVAESGYGKSTLAHLAEPGWNRVSDDILPITLTKTGAQALPHFPQLKLAPGAQYAQHRPARPALDRIFLLQPQDPASTQAFRAELLTADAATLALISHTIAARLFPSQLLQQQLKFMAEVATRVTVTRLYYPKSLSLLPDLRAFIRECSKINPV